MNFDYMIGKVLDDRYEIVEKIGAGGMATVYKAKCRVLDRFVAIKILKDSLKYDTEVVKKFNTESRAAARLSHPNIVQVYDVSESGEFDYIVMEFVDGITLKEYIGTNGKLSESEACNFAAQIGRALDCAHSNGIIHRDIKPHNVLITKDGIAKVADFGIAQATSGETMVAGSGAMGSVHYISPEQARGGYTSERSDIYSLGVVLYEMLTGVVPFDGANPVAVALAKLENEPTDVRELDSHISNRVAEITMKAISKEQHARFQSALLMVSELEAFINTGVSLTSQEEKFETKRIKNEQTKEEYHIRKAEKEKRRKKEQRNKLILLGVVIAAVIGIVTFLGMNGGAQEYPVPDLKGYTIEEAEEILKQANLRLNSSVEYEENEEFESGTIIDQQPGFNQYVKKNRKIKVVVSLGNGEEEKKNKVPKVEGLKQKEAEKLIKDAGLKCVVVEEVNEDIEVGYVIRQSPKVDSLLEKGEEVTIYVSGEGQAVVPKVTGDNIEEAKRKITEAGLLVGTVDVQENESEKDTVIAQNPAAGTGIVSGARVNLTVSEGPKEVHPSPTATTLPQVTTTPRPHTPIPTPQTSVAPISTPAMKRKVLTISIPDGGTESVNIRAVANGREIYNRNHARSERTVDIPVQASKDASVQVYIDGSLVADRVIQFD